MKPKDEVGLTFTNLKAGIHLREAHNSKTSGVVNIS
jgi:hypothetical protein